MGADDETLEWRNVHFYETEIEAARLLLLLSLLILLRLAVPPRDGREMEAARSGFEASCKGITIDVEDPPATARKKRRRRPSPKADEVREALGKLWPNGIPEYVPNVRIVNAVVQHLGRSRQDLPSRSTILRPAGRKA